MVQLILCTLLCWVPGATDVLSFTPASSRREMNQMLDRLELSNWDEIQGGHLLHIPFELNEHETSVLDQIGYPHPDYGILSIGFPDRYDPEKIYPILFTSVTSDIYAPNAYSVRNYFRVTYQKEWIVVSVDADYWPRKDSVTWRLVLFGAAYRSMSDHFDHFRQYPLYFGGYSGGSKFSVYLSYFSRKIGRPPAGIFLGGCNDVPIKEASSIANIETDLMLNVPVYFSIGKKDKISTPGQTEREIRKLRKRGFTNLKSETHSLGHQLVAKHILQALDFFEGENQ